MNPSKSKFMRLERRNAPFVNKVGTALRAVPDSLAIRRVVVPSNPKQKQMGPLGEPSLPCLECAPSGAKPAARIKLNHRVSKTLWFVALSAVGLLAAVDAQAQGAANAAQGYDAFKFVKTRNIFDPNRRPIRAAAPPPVQNNIQSRRRENYIALTGTMVTPDKKLAFFNGARSEYNKVLGVHGKIADFTITDVTPTQVELEIGGKPVVVQVGSRLPLNGSSAAAAQADAEAAAAPTAEASAAAPAVAPAPGNSNAAAAAPAPAVNSNAPPIPNAAPANQSDVMRRMMERRQKETSSK
jgi:hypothetical protein